MITLLPLDSRPCNHSWIAKFGQMVQRPIQIFPAKNCGNLQQGLRHDLLDAWLDEVLPQTTHFIVSADALVSGGLIQARLAQFDIEVAKHRIQRLIDFKMQQPHAKVIVFDTIMRTSITSYDAETSRYWHLMNLYSLALGKAKKQPSVLHQNAVAELERQIPEFIRETYLLARAKKHSINCYFIDLVEQGFIDDLILLQEDSMSEGVQSFEREILIQKIKDKHIESKVSVYNGTDEGSAVLVAKVLLEQNQRPLRLHIHLPNDEVLYKIQPFEDRPFGENLTNMLKKMNITQVSLDSEADFELYIYSEKHPYDLDLASEVLPHPNQDSSFQAFFHSLNHAIHTKKQVAFLDLFFPNGGSPDLLDLVDYSKLVAYSAWNTSSNALGTMLANLVMLHVAPRKHPMMKQFLIERILDDCVYQTITRRRWNERWLAQGINVYNLGKHGDMAISSVERDLKEDNRFFPRIPFRVWFPWNRTFEIDIDLEGYHEV